MIYQCKYCDKPLVKRHNRGRPPVSCGRCALILSRSRHARYEKAHPDRVKACKAAWYKKDPEQRKSYSAKYSKTASAKHQWARHRLEKYYGLTVGEYDAMLAFQNGVCAICKQTCATGKKLAVDHDHETGAVRGLLCARCNLVLPTIENLAAKFTEYLAIPPADVFKSQLLLVPPSAAMRESENIQL